MTIKEKLTYFREKIEKATEFNAEFKNLIGIELFDYIHSNDLLKDEFERRFNYLKNLADDKEFNTLQDNLFETIQKILKLTSSKEVQKRQKEYNNKLSNKLKSRYKNEEEEKDFLTLPEIYVALQNKDNYYRLGDKDGSYFSPEEGEISKTKHIIPIKKQYEITIEGFFDRVFLSNPPKNKEKGEQIKKLLTEYNDYWYEIDKPIYTTPVKLHTKNFEDFFFDCSVFYPREGYEFHYNLFKNSTLRQTEKTFNDVKKNAIVVIDDLIDFVETKQEIISESERVYEKIKGGKDKKVKAITLSLSKTGDLCRQNGKCYEMGGKSKRCGLVRFLVKNSGYQPTKLITETIGYKNNQTTSGEIGKIRKNIGRDLSIKSKEFLEGRKDSGYRINPKYKIKVEN